MSENKKGHTEAEERALRAAENELRRKERELLLRETAVRSRTLELDAFKRACDSLAHDLNEKQAKLNQIEQTHGVLVDRDIALQEREAEMGEADSGVRARAEALTRLERDNVSGARRAQQLLEQRLAQAERKAQQTEQRGRELDALEHELKQRRRQMQGEQETANARMAEREEAMRRLEAHVRAQFFVVERRQAELTGENEDLHDRLRVMRAERAEYEARENEVKLREQELQRLIEEQRTKRAQLFTWEEANHRRAAELEVAEARQGEKAAKQLERESDINARIARVVAAERGLGDKVASAQRRETAAAERERDVDAKLAELRRLEAQMAQQQAEAARQLREIRDERAAVAELRRAARADSQATWAREMQVRQALLELEQRQRTVAGMLSGGSSSASSSFFRASPGFVAATTGVGSPNAMAVADEGALWTAAIGSFQQAQTRKLYGGGVASGAGLAAVRSPTTNANANPSTAAVATAALQSLSADAGFEGTAAQMQLDRDLAALARESADLLARFDAFCAAERAVTAAAPPPQRSSEEVELHHRIELSRALESDDAEQLFFTHLLADLVVGSAARSTKKGTADSGAGIAAQVLRTLHNRTQVLKQRRFERVGRLVDALRSADAMFGGLPSVAVSNAAAQAAAAAPTAQDASSNKSEPAAAAAATDSVEDCSPFLNLIARRQQEVEQEARAANDVSRASATTQNDDDEDGSFLQFIVTHAVAVRSASTTPARVEADAKPTATAEASGSAARRLPFVKEDDDGDLLPPSANQRQSPAAVVVPAGGAATPQPRSKAGGAAAVAVNAKRAKSPAVAMTGVAAASHSQSSAAAPAATSTAASQREHAAKVASMLPAHLRHFYS